MSGEYPTPRGRFRLGKVLVEPQRNRVSGPDGAVSLQPKVMDVLCLLAERQGEVISRAELIDRIWGIEFGADESLTRAISQLRKALQDERAEPHSIETIPKRGYRLITPVLPAGKAVPDRSPARSGRPATGLIAGLVVLLTVLAGLGYWLFPTDSPPSPPAERTGIVVAVAPFVTEAGTPGTAGLAEELSTAIARSPLVRARTTDAARDPAGTMLYALGGTIRHTASQIRVSVQLVESSTGDVIWGETYERGYDPAFSARGSIVGSIASEMMLPLLRSAKARLLQRDVLALAPWELTLLVTWIPGDEVRPAGPPSEDSYWLQRRALELDPDFAPAHALFAQLASYHARFHPPADSPQARARAERHAARAIELAPYDAEVLYQVAQHYRNVGNRARARALLERVIELQPHHPLARLDLEFVRGQCDDGAAEAAQRLIAYERGMSDSNPARWVALGHVSELYLSQGDFGRARSAAQQARAIVPVTTTALPLAAANAELGLAEDAAAVLSEHRREWPDMDLNHFAEHVAPRWCLYGRRTPQAQASFRRLAGMMSRRP